MSWLKIKTKTGDLVYINLNNLFVFEYSKEGIKTMSIRGINKLIDLKDIKDVEFLSNNRAEVEIFVNTKCGVKLGCGKETN